MLLKLILEILLFLFLQANYLYVLPICERSPFKFTYAYRMYSEPITKLLYLNDRPITKPFAKPVQRRSDVGRGGGGSQN